MSDQNNRLRACYGLFPSSVAKEGLSDSPRRHGNYTRRGKKLFLLALGPKVWSYRDVHVCFSLASYNARYTCAGPRFPCFRVMFSLVVVSHRLSVASLYVIHNFQGPFKVTFRDIAMVHRVICTKVHNATSRSYMQSTYRSPYLPTTHTDTRYFLSPEDKCACL